MHCKLVVLVTYIGLMKQIITTTYTATIYIVTRHVSSIAVNKCTFLRLQIFNRSCPSDQEIVAHWLSKSQVAPLPKDKREMYKVGVSKPRYSFDVPPQC